MPSQTTSIAPEDTGTDETCPGETAQGSENRSLQYAIAISLAIHLLVFTFGTARFHPADVAFVPTLQLTLELNAGKHVEKERGREEKAPHTERVIRLGPTHSPSSAEVAYNTPSVVRPDDYTSKSDPPPPPPSDSADDAIPEEETAIVHAAPVESEDVVITTSESEHSVPDGATVEEATVAIAAIPSKQQQTMTRKVLRWAQGLEDAEDTPSQLSWKQDGREYTAVLKRRPAASDTDLESAIVEIATLEEGKELRTSLHLKRLAFSHFTQLVDHWDSNVQLHDDEIVGRFHSNSEITLGYDYSILPRFHGKVTTAAGGFAIAGWSRLRPRTEIFRSGFQARVGRITLPERFLQATSRPMFPKAKLHSFERDTRINFYSDGTYGWQELDKNSREERAQLGRGPVLLVAGRGTELRVRGIVNGNVLVYSPERIWIDGNLVYAQNPRLTQEARNYLGLASDKFVDVARPEVTGPGDLEIDAAIYARRRFTVTAEHEPSPGTLIIFGSLTAGTLSATEPRYATRLEFDPRFEHTRPPGFPMTNHYEVERWDAQWRPPGDALN